MMDLSEMTWTENTIRWLLNGDEWGLFAGEPPALIVATVFGGLVIFAEDNGGMTPGELEIAWRQLRQRLHVNPELAVLDLCYESIQKMAVEVGRDSAQREGVTND